MGGKMNPKISIIVPCYNVQAYISECIESLVNQTLGLENLELIFVNDASTDTTLDILLEYEKKYSKNMMVINLSSNMRQGGARNIGISYATADYIGFVDSDDWAELNMYESLYEMVVRYAPDVVNCGMIRNYESGNSMKIEMDFSEKFQTEKSIVEGGDEFPQFPGGVNTKIYRKSIILNNNIWFPERIVYEDNYWGSIFSLYVKSVVYVNKQMYHYRENFTSTTLKRNDNSHFDRLDIEIMKINKYKELGIFLKFYSRFEKEFLNLYFINTLYIMFTRFDKVPYFSFLKMQINVKKYFPNYLSNKYLLDQKNPLWNELLRLVDMDLLQEDLQYIADVYKGEESESEITRYKEIKMDK